MLSERRMPTREVWGPQGGWKVRRPPWAGRCTGPGVPRTDGAPSGADTALRILVP